MKILLGNYSLSGRTGTEIVTLETAQALARAGHEVCVYTAISGPTADLLRAQGIPVFSRIDDAPWQPDIAHLNQFPLSLNVAAHFPAVPQIYVVHDSTHWLNAAPRLSSIRIYCAVDDICARRIGIDVNPAAAITILANAVDLTRFHARSHAPHRPRRAAVLAKHDAHLDAIAAACEAKNLTLDRYGPGADNIVDDLAERLGHYDLVFASARMALEALACGCATIVVDGRGFGGLVTKANVGEWRRHNFGIEILTEPIDTDRIVRHIERYNADDAKEVTKFIRQDAALETYIEKLVNVYRAAIESFRVDPPVAGKVLDEYRAAIRAHLVELQPILTRSKMSRDPSQLEEHGLIPLFDRLHAHRQAQALSQESWRHWIRRIRTRIMPNRSGAK